MSGFSLGYRFSEKSEIGFTKFILHTLCIPKVLIPPQV